MTTRFVSMSTESMPAFAERLLQERLYEELVLPISALFLGSGVALAPFLTVRVICYVFPHCFSLARIGLFLDSINFVMKFRCGSQVVCGT